MVIIVWIIYIFLVEIVFFLVWSDGVFPGLVALPYCASFQRDNSQCNLWLSLPGNVGVHSVKIIHVFKMLWPDTLSSRTTWIKKRHLYRFRLRLEKTWKGRVQFLGLVLKYLHLFFFLSWKVLTFLYRRTYSHLKDRGQLQTIENFIFVFSFPVLPYYSMVHWATKAPGISDPWPRIQALVFLRFC